MGLGNKIKKAFGFAVEEDCEYDDIIPSAADKSATGLQSHAQIEENADTPVTDDDPELSAKIFETVVETFNTALPTFLRDSVDPKAQREYLYAQLQQSVRDHLAMINDRANRHSEAQWQQRQTSLRAEVETYKEKLRQLEEKQNEAKQAQLSAERQKRALSERVHDLESKVLKLEADAEQTELEKKSLVNKLKVANVHDGDNEAMRSEIEQLRAQLIEARNEAVKSEPEIKTVDNPETERLLAEAITENARLKTEAQRSLDKHRTELEDARAAAMVFENKLNLASQSIMELQEELDHANEELKMAEEIQERIEKFEEIKQRQETRISKLKQENSALRQELDLANEKITELSESSAPAPLPAEDKQIASAATKLFDDVLDDTSWVPEPIVQEQTKPQDEFGYKPPKKRPAPPADDATRQLSLF